uniref:Uncharacterized protein n=1 Tax=Arundo donax TaxID=35708 RepID=A0A0A9ACS4_ARUDO
MFSPMIRRAWSTSTTNSTVWCLLWMITEFPIFIRPTKLIISHVLKLRVNSPVP